MTERLRAILEPTAMLTTRGIHPTRESAARWLGIHPKGGKLVAVGRPVSRDELADLHGLHPKGGSYGTNLGWHRGMGVITPRGPIQVTDGLMR